MALGRDAVSGAREDGPGAPGSGGAPEKRERLYSLDAFRGFDIAAMLLVNMTWNRAVFHPQLFHVDWNAPVQGATFTDLVFPWFLFIAGAAIPLSMRSGRGRAMGTGRTILEAWRRGMVIYLLGVLLTVAGFAGDAPVRWTHLFSWNILQLIGVGYAVAATVCVLRWKWQAVFVALVLIAKLATLTLIPAEFARGVMEGAGYAPRVMAGAAGEVVVGPGTFTHFDDVKRLLALEHLRGAESGVLPRLGLEIAGWFGMASQWLPCAAIAVLGSWATVLLTDQTRRKLVRAGRAALFGVGLIVLAYLLQAGYRAEGGGWLGLATVPFSKWLFSPAYCLLAAGTGAVLYAGFYAVIDAWGWTRATALRVYGLNAIALYVGAELSFKLIFGKWQIEHPNGHGGAIAGGVIAWGDHWASGLGWGDHASALAGGVLWVTVWLGGWWLFCYGLYRRKWFIKV